MRIMTAKAFIAGLKGLELNSQERAFFATENPWGFILFARNIDTPQQVEELCASLRDCVGRPNAPILIDQEGGRVQRLKPPHWARYPAGADLGALYGLDREKGLRATWLLSRLHAFDLSKLGFTIDCLPVLDVPSSDGHNVIGDRAYASDVNQVIDHGRAACEGLLAGGVAPVLKHIPGHGRATADSHHAVPVVKAEKEVLLEADFAAFKALSDQGMKYGMAMTAHVIYSAIDPEHPATTSSIIIQDYIRGHMGFDGLLMTDDICMGALSGDFVDRTRASFDAGCDIVMHCHAHMDEMIAVASQSPVLEGKRLERATAALRGIGKTDDADEAACRAEFAELMAPVLAANGDAVVDPTNYGKTA